MKNIKRLVFGLTAATTVFLPARTFATGGVWNEEYGEYTYTINYDFNGGATYNGQGTYSKSGLVAVAPNLSEGNLISCFEYDSAKDECHSLDVKKGKSLSYVTVNGERHDLGPDDGFMLNQDTDIVYYWNDEPLEDYALEDDNGNSISFNEEEGHNYNFNVNFFSFSMTDADLEKIGLSREEYEAGKAVISNAIKEAGETVAYLEIEVYEVHPCEDYTEGCYDFVHEGPFDVRIKFTDAMAGFNTYKLVYVNMAEDGTTTVEEGIELTLVDGYLVGTVPHLSGYALVGSNTPLAPNTGAANNTTEAISKLPLFSIIVLITAATTIYVSKKAKR